MLKYYSRNIRKYPAKIKEYKSINNIKNDWFDIFYVQRAILKAADLKD
jgi:hypothetical protein